MRRVVSNIFLILAVFSMCCSSKPTQRQEKGTNMKEIFSPVVAGSFYPSEKGELESMLKGFDREVKKKEKRGSVFGLISPHAGYIYSGRTAAYGFKLVSDERFDLIVVMAPSHRMRSNQAVLLNYSAYRTPLGDLPIDTETVSQLLKDSDNFISEPAFFKVEHSLEVQLPFIQFYLKGHKILPIIVPVYNKTTLKKIAQSLYKTLSTKKVLFIASSDMSHYRPYDENNKIDEYTFSVLKKNDPDLLFEEEMKERTQLCGFAPVVVLMNIARLADADGPYVIYHENSGDTAGDKSAVVGYGSVAYFKGGKTENKNNEDKKENSMSNSRYFLTDEEKIELLKLARSGIEYYFENKKEMDYTPRSKRLIQKGAAFVTLKKHGNLRGCIGHIIASEPLYKSVLSNALNAAFSDPRFTPITRGELSEIEIEISVLTPLEPVKKEDIVLGRDGLLLTKGFNKGVFLPQVPEEAGWKTVDEYLTHLCQKAGLPMDCYKKGDVKLERFEAIVFHEKELLKK